MATNHPQLSVHSWTMSRVNANALSAQPWYNLPGCAFNALRTQINGITACFIFLNNIYKLILTLK